jgi:hypothetical protein
VIIDEWTYNSGRNTFIRILTLTNNMLTDIKEADYGSGEQKAIGALYEKQSSNIGDAKAGVRIMCGEPFGRIREKKR